MCVILKKCFSEFQSLKYIYRNVKFRLAKFNCKILKKSQRVLYTRDLVCFFFSKFLSSKIGIAKLYM